MLMHPMVPHLTVRQRAAVAWTAQGLSSAEIGKRMGLTGQRVRYLLVSAEARLRRYSNRSYRSQTPMPELCWDGVLDFNAIQGADHEQMDHAD